ncbi:MAG: cytochrome c3 family protein, partial [Shewanella sp.]
MNKLLLTLVIGTLFAGAANAGELVKMKGSTHGRANHEFIYQEGCKGCHQGSGKQNSTDAACVECHGEITSIPVDEKKLP